MSIEHSAASVLNEFNGGESEQVSARHNMASVLIVDDEPGIRSFLKKGLSSIFGLVDTVDSVEMADELRQRCHYDLLIVDIRLPGLSGVEWVTDLREQGSMTSVIFMTAYADLETAIEALRAGAADFMMKPFRMEQMLTAVKRCMEHQKMLRENYVLRRQVEIYSNMSGMIGDCSAFKKVCALVKQVAPVSSTVLIEGETGTGKELVAHAIHKASGRSGSFVPINCGAMTAELLESELFGHSKGAFTGANSSREGLFSYANEGTLFLDEIGEMPLSMQTHLLRVLQERSIRPVGANKETPIDVRVLAATNKNLEQLVASGEFREDLFYRLNVLSIRIPPLRERKEDLVMLAQHFWNSLSNEMGIDTPEISELEFEALGRYEWPGNIRELRNVIERSLLLNLKPINCIAGQLNAEVTHEPLGLNDEELGDSLEHIEKQHILKILAQEKGNKTSSARVLGVSRKTLERKTKAWNNEAEA